MDRTKKRRLIAVAGLAFILVSATQGAQAARDACGSQRKALKRHSVEPLISQRTTSKYSDCAGDIAKSVFKMLKGDELNTRCGEILLEQSVQLFQSL